MWASWPRRSASARVNAPEPEPSSAQTPGTTPSRIRSTWSACSIGYGTTGRSRLRSWTARGRSQIRPRHPIRVDHPLGKEPSRVRRIDDLLHPESLGGSEGRAQRVKAGGDLGFERRRVVRRLQVAPVGRLDTALERQRAPVAAGPREAKVERLGVAVTRAGDTEDLADQDRDPGDSGLVDRGQRTGAAAYGAGPLGLDSDDEPRLVDEVDDGQVEGVREVDEAGQLVRSRRGQSTPVDPRVGGHNRDGVAVQPGQGRDHRAAETAAQLEQRVAVNHERDQSAHVVDLAAAAGDDAAERGFGPERVVAAGPSLRQLPDALWQVGEEAGHLSQRVVLALGQVVDRARFAGVYLPAAQVLFGHLAPHAVAYDGRAGDEELRAVAHHHREVGADNSGGSEPCHRPQACSHDRVLAQIVDHDVPARIGRDVGPPGLLVRLYAAAAACAVDQPHQGQAQLAGQPLGVDLLLVDGRIRRPAAHGEVIAADDDPPASDAASSHHAVGRREALQLAVLVHSEAGQGAVLLEAARVQQTVDPLADGQPPRRVLAGDAVATPHLARQLFTVAQLFQLWLPGHKVDYPGHPRARFPPVTPTHATSGTVWCVRTLESPGDITDWSGAWRSFETWPGASCAAP